MRFKRQGLTPKRTIVAYALALFLVLGHEADRLADWLEALGRSDSKPGQILALNLAADLKAAAKSSGIKALGQAEDRVLAALSPAAEVGSVSATPMAASYRNLKSDASPAWPKDNALTDPALNLGCPDELCPDNDNSASAPQNSLDEIPSDSASIYPRDSIPLAPYKPNFYRVLLVGDSMMLEGLGPPLQKALAKIPGLTVSREGKYATGLCRLDVFDWFKYFEDLLAAKEPDLVAISIGANDTQDIVENGQRHLVTTEKWREIYGQRVAKIIQIAAENNAQVVWIGLPIMGKEPYNARAAAINEVAEEACQRDAGCRFFDSWGILAEEGKYSTFLAINDKKIRVRAKDNIHLTESGGRIMAEECLAFLENFAILGEGRGDPEVLAEGKYTLEIIDDPAKIEPALALEGDLALSKRQNQDAQNPDAQNPDAQNPETQNQEAKNPGTQNLEAPKAAEGLMGPLLENFAESGNGQGINSAPIPVNPKLAVNSASSAGPFTPKTPGAMASAASALIEASFESKFLGREVKYLAYAPKSSVISPTVFLLPGVGENYTAFATHFGEDLFRLADQYGLILVMIDSGKDGWYLDSPVKANSAHETSFFKELLPDAFVKLPIDKERLGLLGISMGGHGALNFALSKPLAFKAVATMSAITDLSLHGSGRINEFLGLKEVLGPYPAKAENWRAKSAYQRARANPEALAGVSLNLTVGLSDKLALAENRQFSRLLTDLGIPRLYREDSGGHDWKLWASQLPGHMAFLAERLNSRSDP
jgi:S-formylglutathione hydrolase FrmB